MSTQKGPYFPNGILLNLFKQVNASQIKNESLTKNTPQINTLIAFGNFDRLCFRPVNDNFSNFRNLSCEGHQWIGGRKDILLYAIPLRSDAKYRTFGFIDKEGENQSPEIGIYTHQNDKAEKVRRRFLSVSTFYVSGKIKNIGIGYLDLLLLIQKRIAKVVSVVNRSQADSKAENKTDILFEVFGSVNPTEIVILWASDQYVDIQYIVDQLRYLRIKLPKEESDAEFDTNILQVFLSTYTIIGLTENNFSGTGVEGNGMIQLVGATEYSPETSYNGAVKYIKEAMKNADQAAQNDGATLHCAGEYDIICSTPVIGLSVLAKEGENGELPKFNYKNTDFKKFFSSTTTRLCYSENDVLALKNLNLGQYMLITPSTSLFEKKTTPSSAWNEQLEVFKGFGSDEIRKEFTEYKTKLAKYIHRPIAGYLYNLELLFCDYVQCVSSLPDVQWAKDFETQFKTAIELLDSMLVQREEKEKSEIGETGKEVAEYIEIAQEIIDILKQQIHHMSDAGKLSFEEPATHSESTSQYDLVLHTFYGIIKKIMESVADKSSSVRETPTQLIPILRFSSKPIIKSKLYLDEHDLEAKLVDICIPYDACGEPSFYSTVLIHELFHYIPPADRAYRNEAFAKILITEVLVDAFQQFFDDDITDLTVISIAINTIRGIVFSYFNTQNITDLVQYPNESKIWNSFSQSVCYWIAEREEPEDDPLGEHLNGVIDYLEDKLKKANNEAVENETLRRLEVELSDAEKKKTLKQKIKEILVKYDRVYDAVELELRELFPDHEMLTFTQIDLADYLILIAITQEKKNLYAEDRQDADFLEYRLGFAVDSMLLGFEKNIDDLIPAFASLRSDFCRKYNMYVKTITYKHAMEEQNNGSPDQGQAWFTFFEKILLEYVRTLAVYRPIFHHLYNDTFSVYTPITKQPWKAIKQFFSNVTILHAEQLEQDKKKLFDSELNVIHVSQPQRFLSEIKWSKGDKSTEPSAQSKIRRTRVALNHRKMRSYAIYSLEHLIQPIKQATYALSALHEKVFRDESLLPELWYRGISNYEYEILPSALRKYKCLPVPPGIPTEARQMGTLAEYQRFCLEQFKYKADGAPEKINSSSYRVSDYIALMQHYSHPTCYLDWSDDVFTSLFFALEDYFPSGDKEKREKEKGKTAALYIMDPMLYNRARKMLLNKYAGQILRQLESLPEEVERTVSAELQSCKITVPNVSIPYAEKQYGIHSMKLIHQNGLPETAIISNKDPKAVSFSDDNMQEELWNLPLAIHTSRLNPRIRAQSGSFLAYSIFSRPVLPRKKDEDKPKREDNKDPEGVFSYLSLQKIQEFFLSEFPEEGPFMIEVLIMPGIKESIAQYLFRTGINKYRIYPELDNTKNDTWKN